MRQVIPVPGWISVQRLLAVLSLVLLSLGALPGAALAQQGGAEDETPSEAGIVSDTEWESPQFGAGVTWEGGFELIDDPEGTFSNPAQGMDAVSLGTDTLYFSVAYINSPDETPVEYMDRVATLREDGVDGYSLVSRDTNADGDVASMIYLGEDRGDAYAAANEVTYFDKEEGILQFVALNAWVEEATDGFTDVQNDIEVAGAAPFQLIDAADLDTTALQQDDTDQPEETDSTDTDQPEETDSTDTDQQSDEDEPADGPNIKDNSSGQDDSEDQDVATGDSSDTPEEDSADNGDTGPAADATPAAGDQAALGIVGRRAYASPQFDAAISWGRPWSVVDANLVSDTQGKQDNIALIDSDDNLFQATFLATRSETPEAYLERLISFRTDLASTESLEVLDQGTVGDRVYAVYVVNFTDGTTLYELSEVGEYAEGVLFKVEMQVDPANVQDAFDAMQDEIEVDGDAPFLFQGDFPEMNGE